MTLNVISFEIFWGSLMEKILKENNGDVGDEKNKSKMHTWTVRCVFFFVLICITDEVACSSQSMNIEFLLNLSLSKL